MIAVHTDREMFWLKVSLVAGCFVSGILLALLIMQQRGYEHRQRARDKCTDTVRATNGTQAELEKCFPHVVDRSR